MRDREDNAFAPLTGPKNCSKCGGRLVYTGRGAYQCEDCDNVDLDDFGRIAEYLDVHGPTSAPMLSRALGMSIGRIRELIEQGRLEPLANGQKTLDENFLEKALPEGDPSKKVTGTYVGNPGQGDDENKMRFLKRNSKDQ